MNVIIKNKTNKNIVAEDAIEAKSFTSKLFGLILEKKPKAMIFKSRFGIHSFFMKYKIDLIIADGVGRIVKIKVGLMPNNIFLWNPRYSTIIELPEGSIESSKTKVGDFLEFI